MEKKQALNQSVVAEKKNLEDDIENLKREQVRLQKSCVRLENENNDLVDKIGGVSVKKVPQSQPPDFVCGIKLPSFF
jgi:phage shock protein A